MFAVATFKVYGTMAAMCTSFMPVTAMTRACVAFVYKHTPLAIINTMRHESESGCTKMHERRVSLRLARRRGMYRQ